LQGRGASTYTIVAPAEVLGDSHIRFAFLATLTQKPLSPWERGLG
jgi:hypothetical protein